jgi:hypothetical protein
MSRFWLLTYITPQRSPAEIALEFFSHYLRNINPWRLAVTGEVNIRDHVGNMGSLLLPTIILGSLGLILVLVYCRHNAWWRFLLYALIVSVVPASLTTTEFPQIRLIALPVLLHVFLIPAVSWLLSDEEDFSERRGPSLPAAAQQMQPRHTVRRAALGVLLVLMLVQGLVFRLQFHREGPPRWYVFDEQFPREVFPTALSLNRKPIYLYDPSGKSGYISSYWYGVLQGINASQFVRMLPNERPPAGAVVISTEEECSDCHLILKSINYIVYVAGTDDLGLGR